MRSGVCWGKWVLNNQGFFFFYILFILPLKCRAAAGVCVGASCRSSSSLPLCLPPFPLAVDVRPLWWGRGSRGFPARVRQWWLHPLRPPSLRPALPPWRFLTSSSSTLHSWQAARSTSSSITEMQERPPPACAHTHTHTLSLSTGLYGSHVTINVIFPLVLKCTERHKRSKYLTIYLEPKMTEPSNRQI